MGRFDQYTVHSDRFFAAGFPANHQLSESNSRRMLLSCGGGGLFSATYFLGEPQPPVASDNSTRPWDSLMLFASGGTFIQTYEFRHWGPALQLPIWGFNGSPNQDLAFTEVSILQPEVAFPLGDDCYALGLRIVLCKADSAEPPLEVFPGRVGRVIAGFDARHSGINEVFFGASPATANRTAVWSGINRYNFTYNNFGPIIEQGVFWHPTAGVGQFIAAFEVYST